jgi:hypothetical protein
MYSCQCGVALFSADRCHITPAASLVINVLQLLTAAAAAAACRPSRPLYFHTDDSRLRSMFVALSKNGITPKPSKLPDM